MNCAQCGNPLISQAEIYRLEVKKIDRDAKKLALIAPPILRASIQLYILIFWVWISIIYPAFAMDTPGRSLFPGYGIVLGLAALWFFLWQRAKEKDKELFKVYESVLRCSTCRVIP